MIILTALTGSVVFGGCALDKQSAPPLGGPSEFGLSLTITATPDIISQDGASQAVINILARDAQNQPVGGVTLRAGILVGGTPVDFGALSSRTVSTGTDGRASLVYLSPGPPPSSVTSDTTVTISVTPVGSDFANSTPRFVDVRLARPGVILPPNGTPRPSFFFSPTAPREAETILFDASPSTDDGQIVSYLWNFGDGATSTGIRPTHAYQVAGSYNVVLTVTDDRGLTASTSPSPISVTALNLIAAFTVSPTDPGVGTSVHFNGRSSVPPAGRSIVAYDWDFGDGTPHGGGAEVDHVYTTARTFTIVLTVTDSAGQIAVTSRTLTVK